MPSDFRTPTKKQVLAWNLAEYGEERTPSPPEEPSPYFNQFDFHRNNMLWNGFLSPNQENDEQGEFASNALDPNISIGNIITYSIGKLIQNLPERGCKPLPIWFGNIKESTTWEIQVKIYAAELPVPHKETLWIDLKIQDVIPSSP